MMDLKNSESAEEVRGGRAAFLSAVLLCAPLAFFGELLIERTHHRPLGAAAFATGTVLLWICALIFSRRIYDLAQSRKGARIVSLVWSLGIVAALAAVLRGFF